MSDNSSITSGFPSEIQAETPTFGMKLVGISFNPSGDPKVNKAKQLCAQLADLLYNDHKGKEATDMYDELYHHAIGEILNAQMNVVKVLTLKY
jgi:hypothetical protein